MRSKQRPAFWTWDEEAAKTVGHLYYFAPTNRAPSTCRNQRHVEAIIDIADDGTLAGVELIDNMPPPPSPTPDMPASGMSAEPVAWRCFHCDEVFTDEHCAREHFGSDETRTPACQIKGSEHGLVEALREAENDAADAWHAIHAETTDAAKAYYSQNSRHQRQMRAVEQVGYERGIADAKAYPGELGLYTADSLTQELAAKDKEIEGLIAAVMSTERKPKISDNRRLLLGLLTTLAERNGGLRYHGHDFGHRRYNSETGEPYFIEPRSAEITLFGRRADLLQKIIGKIAEEMLAELSSEDEKAKSP